MALIARISDHSFLADLIREQDGIIIDGGSNHGLFAESIRAATDLPVLGFEPDPRLFAALPTILNVEWHPLALTADGRNLQLALGKSSCSSAFYRENATQQTSTVPSTSLAQVLDAHAGATLRLLKLDIEGAELEVLESLPEVHSAKVAQITVEFHDFLNPSDKPRIEQILKQYRQRGFYVIRFSFFTYGDCLLINRKFRELSVVEQIRLVLVDKYWRGVKRLLGRVSRRLLGPFR